MQLSRLERLLAVYRETGDTAKLGEVEALQAKENKRYGKIIESFKQRLGPAYRQFEPQLLAGQNRKADPAAEKPALKPGEPTPAPRRVAKPPVKGEKVGGGQ